MKSCCAPPPNFFLNPSRSSLFKFIPIVSYHLHHSPLWSICLCLLHYLLLDTGKMLLGPLETASSPGSTSADIFLHSASVSAPSHLGGFLLNSDQFVNTFLVLGSLRLDVSWTTLCLRNAKAKCFFLPSIYYWYNPL